MRSSPPRRIGLIAGGRTLPREIADSLARRGAEVHVVALEGEATGTLAAYRPTVLNIGRIGAIIASLRRAGCREVVFAGTISRPDLSRIRPDLGFFRALPTVVGLMRAGGDDAVLRGVIAFFEGCGLAVVGPLDVAPELALAEGPAGSHAPDAPAVADADLGLRAIAAMAPFDIGQAVIVAEGRVVAIEGAEGTDAMIERFAAGRLAQRAAGEAATGGLVVKRAKPGQELRVDLPVIGPDTVRRAAGADLSGIAVEAGRVLVAERAETVRLADAHRLFVTGVAGGTGEPRGIGEARSPAGQGNDVHGARSAGGGAVPKGAIRRLGRKAIPPAAADDIWRAANLIAALGAYCASRAVVIADRHVLVVEAGEGAEAAIARSAAFDQWGKRRWRGRLGVAVLDLGREATVPAVEAAHAAGLAGVAVRLRKFAASVPEPVVARADALGLFMAGVDAG
ncbi:MAG: UDP-2,3-diacylglucosamine diphosphatase LpxI [Hyphomicrobiaceae bacterium]|nr:UDP-2,3-diacylglucosamine diphosphatase LpxI [Hyphomicrobiaceae bacterium]